MTIHLTIGGSTAERTLACPGWINASKNVHVRSTTSPAAAAGSMHHMIMEKCLLQGKTPSAFIGRVYNERNIVRAFEEDDRELSEIAYAAVNKLFDKYDIEDFFIEPFVQLEVGVIGGSIDVLALSSGLKTVLVIDYKFGRKKIRAEDNDQLKLYTVSAMADPTMSDVFKNVETIRGIIIQPQSAGIISETRFSREELAEFSTAIYAAAALSETADAPVIPGKHCTFCPAAAFCPARRAVAISATLLAAKSSNELSEAAAHVEEIEDWVKSVKEELYMQLNRGVVIDGWKIVDKRPTNRWSDAEQMDAAEAEMRKKKFRVRDIRVNKLISAPVALKLAQKMGKNIDLEKYITKSSPGTTLAAVGDDRPAVIITDVQGSLVDLMNSKT